MRTFITWLPASQTN